MPCVQAVDPNIRSFAPNVKRSQRILEQLPSPYTVVSSALPCVVLLCLGKPVPQFGDKFRKAREAKKLSLDDVSRVTKIGARMLQAIEEEHFEQLPGGVFNRGFIRAYAKHLGLNDEEAVNDYLACLRQAQIDANQFHDPAPVPVRTAAPAKTASAGKTVPPAKPAPPQPTSTSRTVVEEVELPDLQLPRPEDVRPAARSHPPQRQTSFPSVSVLLAIIVVLVIALLWMRHSRSARPQAQAAEAIKTSSQPAPTQSAPSSNAFSPATTNNSAAASAAKLTTPSKSPENQSPDNKSQVSKTEVTKPEASSLAAHSSPVTAQPEAKQPAPTNSPVSDVTVRTAPKAASTAKPTPSMTLVIRATENTWISVFADGQLVSQETLIAPANTTVHASREITVKLGNAAGVSFLWNKQEIPAQGAESEVKTLIFDTQGLRSASPQPTQQN